MSLFVLCSSFALRSADYTAGCVNTSLCLCDFTHLNVLNEFGEYVARVRAELGSESSAWVKSNNVTLDKHSESRCYTVNALHAVTAPQRVSRKLSPQTLFRCATFNWYLEVFSSPWDT